MCSFFIFLISIHFISSKRDTFLITKMGSSSTKETIEQPNEVVESTGFHVIELHFPSTGPGILFIVLLVGLILLCACFCKKRCNSFSFSHPRRQPQQHQLPYQFPMPPYPFPTIPAYPMWHQQPQLPAPPVTHALAYQPRSAAPDSAPARSSPPPSEPSSPRFTEVTEDTPTSTLRKHAGQCSHSWSKSSD